MEGKATAAAACMEEPKEGRSRHVACPSLPPSLRPSVPPSLRDDWLLAVELERFPRSVPLRIRRRLAQPNPTARVFRQYNRGKDDVEVGLPLALVVQGLSESATPDDIRAFLVLSTQYLDNDWVLRRPSCMTPCIISVTRDTTRPRSRSVGNVTKATAATTTNIVGSCYPWRLLHGEGGGGCGGIEGKRPRLSVRPSGSDPDGGARPLPDHRPPNMTTCPRLVGLRPSQIMHDI